MTTLAPVTPPMTRERMSRRVSGLGCRRVNSGLRREARGVAAVGGLTDPQDGWLSFSGYFSVRSKINITFYFLF